MLALCLVAVPLLVAATPAQADPFEDFWTCIPESPCCDTLVCVPPQPEPCKIGDQYWC